MKDKNVVTVYDYGSLLKQSQAIIGEDVYPEIECFRDVIRNVPAITGDFLDNIIDPLPEGELPVFRNCSRNYLDDNDSDRDDAGDDDHSESEHSNTEWDNESHSSIEGLNLDHVDEIIGGFKESATESDDSDAYGDAELFSWIDESNLERIEDMIGADKESWIVSDAKYLYGDDDNRLVVDCDEDVFNTVVESPNYSITDEDDTPIMDRVESADEDEQSYDSDESRTTTVDWDDLDNVSLDRIEERFGYIPPIQEKESDLTEEQVNNFIPPMPKIRITADEIVEYIREEDEDASDVEYYARGSLDFLISTELNSWDPFEYVRPYFDDNDSDGFDDFKSKFVMEPQDVVHLNWCYLCEESGRLSKCSTCCIAYHKQCNTNVSPVQIDPIATAFEDMCPVCKSGRRLTSGDVVWNKLDRSWWPARIVPMMDAPDSLVYPPTNYHRPILYYGTCNYEWADLQQMCIFNISYGRIEKLAADDPLLKEAINQASDDFLCSLK